MYVLLLTKLYQLILCADEKRIDGKEDEKIVGALLASPMYSIILCLF